ncbi:neuraminidase-like domain-containing protein [Pseudomonas serboccidentalis]|uniref:Neuraminidase-like domain-containing protein n=1 Tax=Pseudomonas serboccidentalis TaxID=2964670 RepID=A0ABY7Z2N2_9PSED|nr:neuraminidase-like domain-containing protein [Pseudomonas serboccidentalis]WDR33869.1 neuraminidase-like domain-containing protein [Pseudomonas serboccidentalis]
MDTLQINELIERYTAAMVEAILGQNLWSGAVSLNTPEDLSQYLMLDTQDSAQLQATLTSSTVRCLQQHIQSVYSGMEPGYESSHFDDEDLQYWYQFLSHYSTWSANVLLKDQAENYIVPSLRLKKTTLFRALENSLNQMRLSTDSVQRGLMEYTQSFQRLCDLDVLSGYIDGQNVQDASYYLIGQERTAPFAYYLRSVKVELDNNSRKINPAAWGEWQKIDIATTGTVVDIRCVNWLGLPVMVWCEWRERLIDNNGVVQTPWSLEIKVAFSSLNGQWSAPLSLHQRESEYDVSNGRLTVVSLGDGDPRDDRLAVCYTNRHGLDGQASFHEIEIHETRDALFRKVPDDTATLLEMTFGRFANAASLQQKVVPAEYSTVTITSSVVTPGSINANLFLDAIYTRERAPDSKFYEVLRVRGRCNAVKEEGRMLERLSISWRAVTTDTSFDIRIIEAGERQLRITLTTRQKPAQIHAVQLAKGESKETIHSFAVDDFKETSTGDGIWVAEAVSSLGNDLLVILLARTRDEVRAGAGFSITGLSDAVLNEQNQVVPRILYAPVVFKLEYAARTVVDPADWSSTGVLDGQYATPWLTYRRQTSSNIENFPIGDPIEFTFGEADEGKKGYGRNSFEVLLTERPRLYPTPSIDKSSAEGAQFLSFNSNQTLKFSRVNSTFGPVLTSRAAVSVDALLAWDTQHVDEPLMPDGQIEENGPFDGCNGLYFWELFFHTPDLVGSRLSAEGRHHEAQAWYEYVFNPLAREIPPPENPQSDDPVVIEAPAYWRCRPLQNETIECSYESAAPSDPDAIGYCAPVHFKIAIFLRYVENLIEWGDVLYRHLDYDSMVSAGLNYSRALTLIGEEPVTRTASTWKPSKLSDVLSRIRGRDQLKAFEASLDLSLDEVPTAMQATPRFDLLGSGVFRPGINERPKALWTLLNTRLNNLRNNRSIDGQPLSIPLFKRTMDPLALLRAQANGNLGAARNPGGQVQVVPYKWQSVYNLALQGVEFLIQQEDQLRSWLELRDRGELDELQQSHMIELADYARSIHEMTIAQLEATAASLRQSESMVKARVQHYDLLLLEGVSAAEYGVLEKNRQARYVSAGSGALRATGAALDLLPNIYGVANGGMRLAAIPYAFAEVAQLTAELMMREAEEASIIEQQRRRKQEWELARDQSNAEVRVLREQLLAQEHAISAARASLQQTEISNNQARAVYAFYKNRTTGRELSNWVVGQVKTLIYQVYDVVAGLCLCAETCWQYEMADYKPRFVRPDVWMDTYHGFTTGQSLKLDLLRMASARIKRDEHRLQLVKTISLKNLDANRWESFKESGTLQIKLSEELFNEDYPGHYCRQVKGLSLTFPGLLGPYQNICATLVQISSSTLLEPDIEAVKYLHTSTGVAPPGSLVQNLRPYQQIGLSLGLDDNGLAQWMDDGRYLPFEGTGAHAEYVLTLPRSGQPSQERLLDSLTDVILTLVYQARDGGQSFARDVEDLLKSNAENNSPDKARVPGVQG